MMRTRLRGLASLTILLIVVTSFDVSARQALDRTMAESQRLVTALSVGKGNKLSRSE